VLQTVSQIAEKLGQWRKRKLNVEFSVFVVSLSFDCGGSLAASSPHSQKLHSIMAFDFSAYLTRIDPSQSYNVNKLQGGVVNFTVRASKEGPQDTSEGRFPEAESLILKQAPPYVAGVGESAPFSQFRQVL
jgi:hypothetical protein